MNKTIFFETTQRRPLRGDFTEYVFPFRLVDTKLIGRPEEMSRSSHHEITVMASGTLAACWNFDDNQQHRVMFEYGKRHIMQKVRDGTLRESEELDLHPRNVELPCPFDPARIENPMNAEVKIVSTDKKLMEDSSFLQIASAIIDARDNINAIFKDKYKEDLIILTQERDLLQFFRDAESSEDFSFRLCALANAAKQMNVQCLRGLTQIENTQVGSINLLEAFLDRSGILNAQLIDTLHNINRMRQGYPVHTDGAERVLKAYRYFAIQYPITDYSAAWKILLNSYLQALQQLLEALKKMDT